MKFFKSYWISICTIFIHITFVFSQIDSLNNEIDLVERIKANIMLLDAGANKAYGMYLARSRDGKYMYVLASNNLSIGYEKKIGIALINNKIKIHDAEVFHKNDDINCSIYKIKSPPKQLIPITRIPQDSLPADSIIWGLDSNLDQTGLVQFKLLKANRADKYIQVSESFTNINSSSPLFDKQGRMVAYLVDAGEKSNNLPSISTILNYATTELKDLDLYPLWDEVYPNQFIQNFVNESVALLLTENSGAGIFLGRDKDQSGYILTANHIIEDEKWQFSIHFFPDYIEGEIHGEVIESTIDIDQDLAIVKVDSCPEIKPVTFIRNNFLENIQKLDSKDKIATIGYDKKNVDWQLKFGSIKNVTNTKIETDLSLISGDSGGPIFNKKGEVLGMNLHTINLMQQTSEDISINSSAILSYLELKTFEIDFKEKWRFYYYPSFWKRNQLWLISGTTAGTVAIITYYLSKEKEKDLPAPPPLP